MLREETLEPATLGLLKQIVSLIAKLLEFYSFNDLFQFYHDRYAYDDTFAVSRSMAYFNDAEDDIDPDTLDKMTWKGVKGTISKGLEVYYRSLL